MTKKEFKKTDSKGREETWEWDETPEVVAALKKLHNTVVENRINRPHDYQGPLYAPHPDLKKDE